MQCSLKEEHDVLQVQLWLQDKACRYPLIDLALPTMLARSAVKINVNEVRLGNSPAWKLADHRALELRCGWKQEFIYISTWYENPWRVHWRREGIFALNAETAQYFFEQLQRWYQTHGQPDSALGILDLQSKI